MMRSLLASLAALGVSAALAFGTVPASARTKTLKMQASWPASLTLYDTVTFFADRVTKLSGGTLEIETMPAGQAVPPCSFVANISFPANH